MAYQSPKYPRFRPNQPYSNFFKKASGNIRVSNAIDTSIFNFTKGMGDSLSRIAYDVAREVMTESKLEFVPVLTGRLRASGRAEIPQINNADGTVSVDLSYNTPYAWVQHETNPRKPKYLERPFWDVVNSGIMEERIARKILQSMGMD
jgi:hypothetical protein